LELKVKGAEWQTKSLELQLVVCRYVAEVGGKALKTAFNSELQRSSERHWARTRAIIQCMDQSHSTMRSTSRNVHRHRRSTTLSDMEMKSLMPDVESMSEEHDVCLECHENSLCLGQTSDSENNMTPDILSENATGDNLKAFEALDGTWELADENDHVEDWLRRLVINGTSVIDGVGSRIQLAQRPDNRILLEGGIVFLVDGVLHRIGKSKKSLTFKRVFASSVCSQSM